MLRKVSGTKSVLKLEELTHTKDIGYTCKELKIKYVGHIAREQNQPEKWNVAAINWIPYGQTRKKGRPATRWVDEIVNRVGPQWMSVAQNRMRWKRVSETHASWWAN